MENTDYGIFPPPKSKEECFDILMNEILGKDWYVVLPMSQDQVNTVALEEMLRRYSMTPLGIFKNFIIKLKNIINKFKKIYE